ncbi:cytochrome c3 family protein [Bacillus sp. X1(2014)]|uniref:cytochrome c3 family protein n=1 Tax=Bacillus sp. X1(2014) TaxID=1565991 RepID=UPI0011A9243A|nr:cytochrome c3 family protein [Bacillus sp. X1(2014)]
MSKIRLGLSTVFMLILLGIFSAVAFAEDGVPPTSTNPAPGIHVGQIDNNGNQSTHKTHGNFQNNTNSCANCHSTHNGEDEMLLMKEGEYDLCMSCHDGTMGFYDVTKGSGAGTFDDSHLSSSMHNVDSSIQVGSAPGKYLNNSTAELECSSCHNPHGSANDRLLNETVAGKAFATSLVNGVQTPAPIGTKTIVLDLQEDPAYAELNAITGTGGLKITKSNGPKGLASYNGVNDKIYYSQFCGACHDDYFAKRNVGSSANPMPGKPSTGSPITATHTHDTYTHTTNSASQGRSCAACHYAHGTDATVMMDAVGNKVADYTKAVADGGKGWSQEKAESYMKDVSVKGSSLKKFTNNAVCFACHGPNIAKGQIDPQYLDGAGALKGKAKIK